MALAEIDALSGYRFDAEQVHTLTGIEDLQRVEMEKEDTKMNVYFNPVSCSLWKKLMLFIWVRLQVAFVSTESFRKFAKL